MTERIDEPLLRESTVEPQYGTNSSNEAGNQFKSSQLETTQKHEAWFLVKSTIPVSVTFVLQYFLSAASIFVVGHLGTTELGAMSLVSVTVGVLGYSIIIGTATCLDTLGAQAYGRGDHRMVGIHVQKCTLFLFVLSIPIVMVWLNAGYLLKFFVPQEELVRLTAQCLKIYSLGLPGFIIFEVAKHFLQVQGIFHASTYILMICTPINLLLNYLLVWDSRIGFGLLGAPTAVIITDWLMAIMSIAYVVFIDGRKCWTKPSNEIFTGWWPMMKLAGAGVVMISAEWLAFDFLTMCSSRLGTSVLAAQSVIGTIATMAFQIPLAMGIACSTRVGNLIGAGAAKSAKTAAVVSMKCSAITGTVNALVMFLGRYQLGRIFSSDEKVVEIIASVLPLAALFQFNDSLGAITGGCLRGQGRQWIGGVVNLIIYYAIMVPISWTFAFVFGWGLNGLWGGMVIGLFLVSLFQMYFVLIADWQWVCDVANGDFEASA